MIFTKFLPIMKDFEWYYDKGYITQRDGNACIKLEDGTFLVTASGARKDQLGADDYVIIQFDKDNHFNTSIVSAPNNNKPSIETAAHLWALHYTCKTASVHVHSPNTVALFEIFANSFLRARLVETLNEGWPELFRHTKVARPVKFMAPGSKELHDGIMDAFRVYILLKETQSDIVVLERHGVLAVGDSVDQCKEHIVRLEHTSTILLKIISASGGNLESIL